MAQSEPRSERIGVPTFRTSRQIFQTLICQENLSAQKKQPTSLPPTRLLGSKCSKNVFAAWESTQRSPDPLAGFGAASWDR